LARGHARVVRDRRGQRDDPQRRLRGRRARRLQLSRVPVGARTDELEGPRQSKRTSAERALEEETLVTIRTATPYLILNGHAERAIALYERALGAKKEAFQRFGDVDGSCPEAQKSHVMHAALRVGEALLMLSDGPGEGPVGDSGNVCI